MGMEVGAVRTGDRVEDREVMLSKWQTTHQVSTYRLLPVLMDWVILIQCDI
jgi:hypothetical protein